MKPAFDIMSTAELRTYLLSHRNDDEAFYKLADRLKANSEDAELYPFQILLKISLSWKRQFKSR